MKITQVVVGAFQENCYLVEDNKHVLIIDPGKNAEKISSYISNDEIVDAILLTHGHFDHIGAVDDLYNQYHCPIYLNKNDEELVHDTNKNTMNNIHAKIASPVNYYKEGKLTIGSFNVEVIFAPGHTEGSTLLIVGNNLFSGDVLFKEGIGRCDLYGGDASKMRESLKIFKDLDHSLNIYPGHDETTTLEEELNNNPYLN